MCESAIMSAFRTFKKPRFLYFGKEAKMEIIIERCKNNPDGQNSFAFKASAKFVGWEVGHSVAEAIGKLVISHAGKFDCTIENTETEKCEPINS